MSEPIQVDFAMDPDEKAELISDLQRIMDCLEDWTKGQVVFELLHGKGHRVPEMNIK